MSLEACAFGSVADNLQRHVGPGAGVDGDRNPLVGNERRHNQGKSLGRRAVRVKELRVDGWIHD